MSKVNVVQNAFNAGELSKDARGRTDINQYETGCRTLENMVVKKLGGVTRRPGTIYDFEIPDPTKNARIARFDDGSESHFILFHDGFAWFYELDSNDDLVATTVDPTIIPAEMASQALGPPVDWELAPAGTSEYIKFAGYSPYMFPFRDYMGPYRISAVASPETGGGSPALPSGMNSSTDYWIVIAGEDRWDTATIVEDPFFMPYGRSNNLFMWLFTSKALAQSRTGQVALAALSGAAGYMRFDLNGVGSQLKLPISLLEGDYEDLQFHQEGQRLFIASKTWPTRVITKMPKRWSVESAETNNRWAIEEVEHRMGPHVHVAGLLVTNPGEILYDVDIPRTGITLDDTSSFAQETPRALVMKDSLLQHVLIQANIADGDVGYLVGKYRQTWDYDSANRFEFDMIRDSPFSAAGVGVSHRGVACLSDGPANYIGFGLAWGEGGNLFPHAISSFEGRLIAIGGAYPQKAYVSSIGPEFNFCVFDRFGDTISGVGGFEIDVIGDTDAQMSAVAVMRSLFLFGDRGVWAIDGGGAALTGTNINASQINAYGSSSVQPLRVEQMLIYAGRTNDRLYGITFKQRNLDDYYSTADISILNSDLIREYVVQMDYQQEPNSSIWIRLESGTLVNIALVERENINGWSRHAIAGSVVTVEDLVVFDDYDRQHSSPYMIVQRDIDSVQTKFVEHMAKFHQAEGVAIPDAGDYIHLDCTVSGTAAGTLITAAHLSNEQVWVVYDGLDYANNPVTLNGSGQATLTGVASGAEYLVGYRYDSTLEPMVPVPPSAEGGGLRTEGSLRDHIAVVLQVQSAIGGEVGHDDAEMNKLHYPEEHDATTVFMGQVEEEIDLNSHREQTVMIRATGGNPLEVDMLVSRVDVHTRGGE